MQERTVVSTAYPSWKEILFISFNIKLIILVSKYKLGKRVCCIFNGNEILHVDRNFFNRNHLLPKKKKNFITASIRSKNDEIIINNVIKLNKSDFNKFLHKGNIWIKRLLHELDGRKTLTRAYSHGDLINSVYCITSGKNIPLFTYCCMIMLPAVIEKLEKNEGINSINETDIKICQNLFPHFDYSATPEYILHQYYHGGLSACIMQIILLSSSAEVDAMNIKQYSRRKRRFISHPKNGIAAPWTYIKNGYSNVGNPSLGEILLCGKITYELYKHHLPENFFPNIRLKDYKSQNNERKYDSEITINVFECRWAVVTIKYENKIFCRSQPKLLRQTLTKIQGVIEIDFSYKCPCNSCCEVREFARGTQNLSNYASNQIKRNILKYGNAYLLPEGIRHKVQLLEL